MPYLTIAQEALARWRAAQAVMDEAEPESPAWQEAFAAAEQAKADYQRAFDDATREHLRTPPPFSEASGDPSPASPGPEAFEAPAPTAEAIDV